MLERTFQLTKGVGPWRERDLWAQGLGTWDDFERARAGRTVMSASLDDALARGIAAARAAAADKDAAALARLVPAREHWRLYPLFSARTACFDIEADGDDVPTVVGVLDGAGVASFRRGHSLRLVAERLAQSPLWVTFNGSTYDVPALKRALERFPEPALHVDLRFLARRLGQKGGLKALEEAEGMPRPPHLRGVKGLDAIRLWRAWNADGDRAALRILVEYNLYDAIGLRPLLERLAARAAAEHGWPPPTGPAFERGDVLYDVSRLLLAL